MRFNCLGAAVLALLLLLAVAVAPGFASTPAWQEAPVVPSLSGPVARQLVADVKRSERKGMRAGVFAKVGDSNTEMTPVLYGMACRPPSGLSDQLTGVARRYNRVRLPNPRAFPGCRPWTSFSRHSSAAQAGTLSYWPVQRISKLPATGFWRPPEGCAPQLTPLSCEVKAIKPRYALIMGGTNDVGLDLYQGITPGTRIEKRLGQVVSAARSMGVVPVLSTIPPMHSEDPDEQQVFDEAVMATNEGIWRLARDRKVPLINLWRALEEPQMVNQGLADDGLHLSLYGAEGTPYITTQGPRTFSDSVNFSQEGLRYGANRRTLILLKTLARLERATR